MGKRVVTIEILFFSIILMASFASAEKLGVITTKDSFIAGEDVTVRASLLDDNNNPIDTAVEITVEDAEKKLSIGKTIPSNSPADVNLGEGAPSGYWKVTAKYSPEGREPIVATALFMVEVKELARFEIKNNVLTVINVGNAPYTKTIQIAIGDTIGSKQVDLGIGESTSFRLVAPAGSYNIKVTDGKTTLAQSEVALTGNVIGILDNTALSRGPLTSGIDTGQETSYGDDTISGAIRNKSLVYIFLLVVFGAGILLAIERNFRKKALSDSKPIRAN